MAALSAVSVLECIDSVLVRAGAAVVVRYGRLYGVTAE